MSLTVEITIRSDDVVIANFKNNAFTSLRWTALPGGIIDDDMKSILAGFVFMPFSNNLTSVLEEAKEQIQIQIVQQKQRLISL